MNRALFLCPLPKIMAVVRGGTFGCAGSFVPVLIALRTAATPFSRSTDRGGSITQRSHTMNTITQVTPEIRLHDGKAVTTSLAVAEYFSKQHKDVLKKIQTLIEQLPTEERERNFAPTFIEVSVPNNSKRKDPAYEITKRGFTLLAMGFTGVKALQFKLRYIDAFEHMESQLSGNPERLPPHTFPRQRFFLTIEGSQVTSLTPVAEGTLVMNPDNPAAWTSLIAELAPIELIPHILNKIAERLSSRALKPHCRMPI
jgi:Rha family phage regulatory protein